MRHRLGRYIYYQVYLYPMDDDDDDVYLEYYSGKEFHINYSVYMSYVKHINSSNKSSAMNTINEGGIMYICVCTFCYARVNMCIFNLLHFFMCLGDGRGGAGGG
jgi:hypothetical protein